MLFSLIELFYLLAVLKDEWSVRSDITVNSSPTSHYGGAWGRGGIAPARSRPRH
jgi:hypothetical protein